jgi:hypothetical protein
MSQFTFQRSQRTLPTRLLSTRWRVRVAVALLPMAVLGCAQDAWKPNPNMSAFLNKVERNCGTARIGELTISQLMNPASSQSSAYFVDLTSRFDTGRISEEEYVLGVSSTFNTVRDSAGIRCVLAQKAP